jgi:imidazolonepropionase-like amidohydrolase
MVVALILILATTTSRASEEIPAPPQSQPIVLKGGTIHPVSGSVIESGEILFEQGKIKAIGKNLTLPANTKSIDVSGKQLYPGLISSNSSLGLIEISSVRGSVDTTETGTINPNIRAEVSVNPDSELIPVTRTNGILTALTIPQIADNGLVAGTGAVIKLDGWTWEEMTLKAPVGMHLYWPELMINRDPRFPTSPEDQVEASEKSLRQLKETFALARAYQKARQVENASQALDLRLEAMLPVLEGKIPLFIHADEIKQIKSALDWTASEKLSMVLVGGTDAWRVAKLLKARDIPVIVSPVLRLPLRRSDHYDEPYANPGLLAAAGVRFAISVGENDTHLQRNLPYQAAMAAAFGLPREEALKSVTLYPAQILGVGDRLGSLEVGKDATLIVTTGDPLEIASKVEMAFIQGRPIDLSNRQIRLYEKYKQKYEQLKK